MPCRCSHSRPSLLSAMGVRGWSEWRSGMSAPVETTAVDERTAHHSAAHQQQTASSQSACGAWDPLLAMATAVHHSSLQLLWTTCVAHYNACQWISSHSPRCTEQLDLCAPQLPPLPRLRPWPLCLSSPHLPSHHALLLCASSTHAHPCWPIRPLDPSPLSSSRRRTAGPSACWESRPAVTTRHSPSSTQMGQRRAKLTATLLRTVWKQTWIRVTDTIATPTDASVVVAVLQSRVVSCERIAVATI